MALTLELAERFIAGAKAKAVKEGWGMSLAVVDLTGHLVSLPVWITPAGSLRVSHRVRHLPRRRCAVPLQKLRNSLSSGHS